MTLEVIIVCCASARAGERADEKYLASRRVRRTFLRLSIKKVTAYYKLLEQEFGTLHGIERSTLLDLITAHEEIEALVVGLGDVLTNATDVDVVVVGGVERGGEAVVRAVVNERHAFSLG